MSMTTGPHAPKKGWLIRWPVQAGVLLLRYPLVSLIGLCGVLVCSAVMDVSFYILSDILSRDFSILISIVLASIPSVCVPIVTCACLVMSEGYGVAGRSDIMEGLRNILVFILIFTCFTAILSLVIMPVIMPDESAGFFIRNRSEMDIFLRKGLSSIFKVVMYTFTFNIFWIVLVTWTPMTWKQINLTGKQVLNNMISVWLMIFLVTVVINLLPLVLHAFIIVPMMIFFFTWLYVAAREIFGGISENRVPAVETDASMARA